MKKLMLVLVLGMLLISLGFASAFDFDNIKSYEEINKKVTITNAFGLGGVIEELTLKSNTDICGDLCSAEKEIVIYQDGVLIDAVRFMKLDNDKWVESNIRDYGFYIKTGEKIIEKPIYNWVCSKTGKISVNGTEEEICDKVLIKTEEIVEPIWEEYVLGTEMPTGTYIVKLEGHKKAEITYDWQITTQGKLINEWAVWGGATGLGLGLRAYFTMNETGNTLYDITQGIYNTTAAAADYGSITGKMDKGRNFTTAANIGGTSAVLQQGNFTWNGWFYDNDGDADLISSANDIGFASNSVKGLSVYFSDGSPCLPANDANPAWCRTLKLAPTASWYMATITYTTNRTLSLYLNGTLAEVFVIGTDAWTKSNAVQFGENAAIEGGGSKADEIGFWNRTLSPSEILQLYNSGTGYTFNKNFMDFASGSHVTLNSPTNNSIRNNPVSFNATANIVGATTLVNMTLWTNSTGTWIRNQTEVKTGITNETVFSLSFPSEGKYLWAVEACDADNDCGFSENRTVDVDLSAPTINITYPSGAISGLTNGQSVQLNYSVNDTNLQTCWRDYNGANTTIGSCANTTFSYVSGVNTIILWANDSANNIGSDTETWSVGISVQNTSHNLSSYETSKETFMLNASNITSASLVYNGTSHAATPVGEISTVTLDLSTVGNISFYWALNGGVFNSSTQYQNVLPISFGLCNATSNVTYVNVTFRNEVSLSTINSTINSVFGYGLGGSKKYYAFSNTSENNNYTFCFRPSNLTIALNSTISAYAADYPSRSFTYPSSAISNSSASLILYLLNIADGVYHTFTVQDSIGTPIGGATVTASTIYSNVSGITDSGGLVQLWLNPNVANTIVTTATGYPSDTRVVNPTSGGSTTITLGTSISDVPSDVGDNIIEGVNYQIYPTGNLFNDTTYTFKFVLTNKYYNLSSWGFTLYNMTNDIVGSAAGTGNSGTAQTNLDVLKNNGIRMRAYWEVDGDFEYRTKTWVVTNTEGTQYSIWHLRNRLITYLDSGIFGLKRGTFSMNLIIFLLILILIGTFSYKFGMDDPKYVLLMLTLITATFEFGLGILDIGKVKASYFLAILTIALFIKDGGS